MQKEEWMDWMDVSVWELKEKVDESEIHRSYFSRLNT